MKPTLVGYNFTGYTRSLEDLHQRHPHVIRRETAVTYRDDFAFEQVQAISERLHEQHLQGWSRSYYLPEKHLEAVLQFDTPDLSPEHIDNQVYIDAAEDAKNGLRSLQRVRALDVLTEMDQVSYKLSTSAGYDYVGEKGPIGGANHDRAIRRAKATLWSAIADDGEGIEHVLRTAVPDVSYTRTQLTDLTEKTKVRQVWGRAFHYILLEGIVATPFIKAVMNNQTFIHAGQDPTVSIPRLLSHVKENAKWLYSLDWKQFDSSVHTFEIHAAFDIIKYYVDFPNYETEQCFEITRQLFIHKKVAAPDGNIYWSHKGIPSGSYFTSLIGSIVNYLRINYLWRILTGHPPKVCFTLGDDSLSGDDILLQPNRIAVEANRIGWFFNPEKTEYSTVPEEITFLGRTFIGGLNARNLVRCLRLLIYPEYPVESGRISAFRARSIADDAGGLSDVLNTVATRLRRKYGEASEDEVPVYFKPYRFAL